MTQVWHELLQPAALKPDENFVLRLTVWSDISKLLNQHVSSLTTVKLLRKLFILESALYTVEIIGCRYIRRVEECLKFDWKKFLRSHYDDGHKKNLYHSENLYCHGCGFDIPARNYWWNQAQWFTQFLFQRNFLFFFCDKVWPCCNINNDISLPLQLWSIPSGQNCCRSQLT